MSAPIKTSYDRTIITMAAEGAAGSEIAAATGRSRQQIRHRAIHLGVWPAVLQNRRDRKAAKPKLNGAYTNRTRIALASGLIPPARVDRTVSNIAHALRAARRHADPAAPVPASFIARVFDAGLTLDEIDATYAVPPAVAVAAIRQHLKIRP